MPTRNGRGHPAIAMHRSPLPPQDVTTHRGIPATTPARTLADLSHTLDRDDLTRALRQARFLRLLDAGVLEELLTRRPSRPLAQLATDLAATQSSLEDALLALCDRHRIPRPRTQDHISGHRADFVWPQQRVVIETDGWQAHGTATAFQADRAIDNALQLEVYTVLRFTHADLHRRPAHVAHQIRRALA